MRRGVKAGSKRKSTPAKKLIYKQHEKAIIANEKYHKADAEEWSKDQEWERWQDEFERRNNFNQFIYPSIQQFAQEKSVGNKDHERWLLKSIGPKPMKEISWKGDWALERVFHLSKEKVELDLLERKILEDRDILKLTIPVAASYGPWKSHLDTVRGKILELLNGEIFEPKPTFNNKKEETEWINEQKRRLDWYQDQMERIFEFKIKLDTLYLKALGIDAVARNSSQIEQAVLRIIQSKGILPQQASASDPQAIQTNNESELWQQAITMEISKSRTFDMPLPEEYKPLEKSLEKNRVIAVRPE